MDMKKRNAGEPWGYYNADRLSIYPTKGPMDREAVV